MKPMCVRCVVSGRVQGVWFRGATREKARELGVSGYAENLDDGRVAVLAYGSEDAVKSLVKWLWQGPPMARVTEVTGVSEDLAKGLHGFQVR